ncbi:MAG: lysine exporter LysO family protein [Bacteroidales bacterium]|nr:lysine exporter LysO family protein [Bacteroidales bacterium]
MKGSLIIIGFFTVGILLAYFNFLPDFILENDISYYALLFLMFFVGIGTGANPKTWQMLKKAKLSVFLVPVSAAIGTWIGVVIVSIFLPTINIKEGLAIGSGFGYYSLSSILISETSGELLGVTALLSNIFREILTLLFTPVIAKYFGKIAPIAVGGATSMDTTLPIITKYVGSEFAIISVFSGTILTIAVPILVAFFLSL